MLTKASNDCATIVLSDFNFLEMALISVIPNLTATSISHVPGRNVMLSFDDDISGALQKVCDNLM